MDIRGPMRRPLAREGAHRNDSEKYVKPLRPFFFFFGDHLISTGKTVTISAKTFSFFFFFGDHVIFPTKLQHFLRLFWDSQSRKSVIFELAPGPRLALGAPVLKQRLGYCIESFCYALISLILSAQQI